MNADELNSLKLAVEKIKTINTVFEKIDQVVSLISAFTTDETKQALVQSVIDNIDDIKAVMATSANIDTIATDLIKGNYLGNRKIDIDLSLNKSTSDATVSYSKATIILTDGTQLAIPFLSGEAVLELTSHNDIRNYIIAHTLWASVQYTECTVEEATSTTNTLIRFRDADGHSSNIERIELAVYSGTALSAKPSYFWANSTSALQTIANRVGDIIALGNDIDKIVELSQNIDELTELQNALASLLDIHTNLTELLKSSTYAQTASTKAGEASASAQSAAVSAQTANDKAALASQKADLATQKANEIKAITVQSTTGAAGTQAQASYNSADGKFSFVIPQGVKGDRGEAFKVSAIGLFSVRVNYDTQPKDFSFFATDTSMIYFKNSDTSADWSAGVPFGKGDKGDTGETGNGISSLSFVSSSLGVVAGIAGATDTYRITMTSGSTFDFNVYNGNEPDVTKSYVDNLIEDINTALGAKASIDAVNDALQSLDNAKADAATTLTGYGITDAYTKAETNSLVGNAVVADATETTKGKVELATSAEVQAGTDTTRVITPAGMRAGLNASGAAPIYACRAWASVNFVSNTINASGNISSIADNGTGDCTFNFITALPDNYYSISGSAPSVSTQSRNATIAAATVTSAPTLKTTTQCRVYMGHNGTSDAYELNFQAFR